MFCVSVTVSRDIKCFGRKNISLKHLVVQSTSSLPALVITIVGLLLRKHSICPTAVICQNPSQQRLKCSHSRLQ